MKNLMANNATKKATIFPRPNKIIFERVKINSGVSVYAFNNLYPVAAAIVGTAKKKENSAANFLVNPCCIPPIILAALLLTPGIIATHCQKPMMKDFLLVICSSTEMFGFLKKESININATPPNTMVIETTMGLSNNASMVSENNAPKISAGKTAMMSFK